MRLSHALLRIHPPTAHHTYATSAQVLRQIANHAVSFSCLVLFTPLSFKRFLPCVLRNVCNVPNSHG